MGRHSPGSHKGREPADGSTHNIICSRAQNVNFQKSPRVGDTPALRCSGGEVRYSPWSDRVGSGSQGSQGQWRQLFPVTGGTRLRAAHSGQLSAVCGHKLQTPVQSPGRVPGTGQQRPGVGGHPPGKEEHRSPPGQPLKFGGLNFSNLSVWRLTKLRRFHFKFTVSTSPAIPGPCEEQLKLTLLQLPVKAKVYSLMS